MITHQSIGAFSLHFWYPDVDNRKNLHFLVRCCLQKSRQSFSIVPTHVRYMLFYFFLTFRKLIWCLAESKIPYYWPKLFIITCFINTMYFSLYFTQILHFIHSDSEFNLNFFSKFHPQVAYKQTRGVKGLKVIGWKYFCLDNISYWDVYQYDNTFL